MDFALVLKIVDGEQRVSDVDLLDFLHVDNDSLHGVSLLIQRSNLIATQIPSLDSQ